MDITTLRDQAFSRNAAEILEQLSVERERGLSSGEVKKRLKEYGRNELEKTKRRSLWQILIDQFKSPIIGLLAIAAILAFAFQEWIEGIAVLIAIFLNTAIGFFTEMKALKSMESLQQLSKVSAKVRREGQVQTIPAEELVPGDIAVFESGDLVAADLRLVEISKLQVDESALTGESLPVTKTTEPLSDELPLAEQKNLMFKGTAITRGSGEGVVIATGMDTELGHISSMTAAAEQEVTPLEKRLDQLGRRLIWVTLAIATVVAIAGIIGGRDLMLMVETAIALSVAAVPEGLPIVATVALARGMWRMAKRNALINRLSAVETLGATNIICTDKTGTLTENRMTVTRIVLATGQVAVEGRGLEVAGGFTRGEQSLDPSEDEMLRSAIEVGVLCNNATLPQNAVSENQNATRRASEKATQNARNNGGVPQAQEDEQPSNRPIGDPMEVALLVLGAKANLQRETLLQEKNEIREIAFDPDSKMMATIHEESGRYQFAVKGAPEKVLEACSQVITAEGIQPLSAGDRQQWQDWGTELAESGLRILALATKTTDQPDEEPYRNLALVGIVGLEDPPRSEVKKAIAACHDAGIRVIMVTGDQPVTARKIGLSVGVVQENESQVRTGKDLEHLDQRSHEEQQQLQQVSIFARVSPEQKLNLVQLHQNHKAIVAMTGDGVNDAPALKKADIGVAMGQRGTQVAKEAADMVLQDDAFASIVAAVAQGRAIFRNIRKFTLYLLSGNAGEIIAVGAASLTNAPLPLLPLQILFLNAINDVFPALALGVGPGSPQLMKQPPRSSEESVLTSRHWTAIALYGALIAAATLGVFAYVLEVLNLSQEEAITISFLSLAFGRLWHVFNMREDKSGLIKNEITTNIYIWGALLICTGLLLSAVYFSPLAAVLQTTPPSQQGWFLIAIASLIPLIVGQIWKVVVSLRQRNRKGGDR